MGDNRETATYQLYFTDSNGKQVSDVAKIIADEDGMAVSKEEFQINIAFATDDYDFFS